MSSLIPDYYLEAAVRKELGKPEGRPLTRGDLKRLGKLVADYKRIKNLSGLEHAVNLTELNLGNNEISDITPLAALTNLKRLDLGAIARPTYPTTSALLDGNPNRDVSPLASLTNLEYLNLSKNEVRDVSPLASLTKLTELDLYGNYQIRDVSPLASLTNLTELHLQENKISDVSPLASLTNLTRLALNDNQISDVSPLASLTNLTTLGLYDNQISNIGSLASLTNLTKLELGGNPLSQESIDVHVPNLKARGVEVTLSPKTQPTPTNYDKAGITVTLPKYSYRWYREYYASKPGQEAPGTKRLSPE